MKTAYVTPAMAQAIAGDRWPIVADGGEALLPNGCQLRTLTDSEYSELTGGRPSVALQLGGLYLLKGYAADGSDVDTLVRTAGG